MRPGEAIKSRLLASDGDWPAYLRYWMRWARSIVLPPLYRGDRVECPICEGRFRRFADLRHSGTTYHEASCPRCGSLHRHRVLWLYLKRETSLLTDPVRVLHVAPDWAFYRKLSRLPSVDYVSGDLQRSPMVMTQLDITAMPFADDEFDLVLCSHVLEHVQEDRVALAEIHRVLRLGGQALLQHPIGKIPRTDEDPSVVDPAERLRRWGQTDHVRVYGDDYGERLRDAGFDVEFHAYEDELPAELVERQRLLDDPAWLGSQRIAVCSPKAPVSN